MLCMDNQRLIKDLLYEQVSRLAKAVASPKRLELIEVLCQGSKTVEQLAHDTELSVKLTSAHLKELKAARLVRAQRDGKYMIYELVDNHVADLWVMLRELAEERLLELQHAMQQLVARPDELKPVDSGDLLARAQRGEIVIIDVRPGAEYRFAHLPYARSLPLDELRQRLNELPADKTIVAYCRGPFCLMANEAVDLLRKEGLLGIRMESGVAEWRLQGLPLVVESLGQTLG